MLYQSEFILMLWLFPVTVMVFFPLVLAAIGGMLKIMRYKQEEVIFASAAHDYSPEKRKLERVVVQGVTAFLQHKDQTCSATVANVSLPRICIGNIPHLFFAFFEEGDRLKLWLQKKDRQLEMLIHPRWEKVRGTNKMIGAEIVTPPRQWVASFASGNPAMALASA